MAESQEVNDETILMNNEGQSTSEEPTPRIPRQPEPGDCPFDRESKEWKIWHEQFGLEMIHWGENLMKILNSLGTNVTSIQWQALNLPDVHRTVQITRISKNPVFTSNDDGITIVEGCDIVSCRGAGLLVNMGPGVVINEGSGIVINFSGGTCCNRANGILICFATTTVMENSGPGFGIMKFCPGVLDSDRVSVNGEGGISIKNVAPLMILRLVSNSSQQDNNNFQKQLPQNFEQCTSDEDEDDMSDNDQRGTITFLDANEASSVSTTSKSDTTSSADEDEFSDAITSIEATTEEEEDEPVEEEIIDDDDDDSSDESSEDDEEDDQIDADDEETDKSELLTTDDDQAEDHSDLSTTTTNSEAPTDDERSHAQAVTVNNNINVVLPVVRENSGNSGNSTSDDSEDSTKSENWTTIDDFFDPDQTAGFDEMEKINLNDPTPR